MNTHLKSSLDLNLSKLKNHNEQFITIPIHPDLRYALWFFHIHIISWTQIGRRYGNGFALMWHHYQCANETKITLQHSYLGHYEIHNLKIPDNSPTNLLNVPLKLHRFLLLCKLSTLQTLLNKTKRNNLCVLEIYYNKLIPYINH